MTAAIRPFAPGDLDALYDVCVRTAASGDDLSPDIGDPLLPGHLYAGPYVTFEPELAFVVEDDKGVAGYILGTDDTAAFEERCESEWFPALRDRYPEGTGASEVDNRLIVMIHRPPIEDPAIVAEYPAHLHIDLLPRVQGQGWGRKLVEHFSAAVTARGACGVHLGVGVANRGALAFYRRVGFEELRADSVSVVLGLRLETARDPDRRAG